MRIGHGVVAKSFLTDKGGAEHYLTVEADGDVSLQEQIHQMEARYAEGLAALHLDPDTAIFRRILVSDVLNQAELVRASTLMHESEGSPVAVSLLQQPPLSGAKIAMLAYHVTGGAPTTKRRLSQHEIIVERGGARHLWSTGLCAAEQTPEISSEVQTHTVFDELIGTLKDQGATLASHCVRTWIYVKDVDVFYYGVVKGRRELFVAEGLNKSTHYIASTGIEGACAHQFDVVAMDAYSVLDVKPQQISYLNDFSRLNRTSDYNVTFERGTRVAYADRAHHFISGTASIDNTGQILHPGDVLAQLDRAIENVDALLISGGARFDDMTHLTVYLRDITEYPKVKAMLIDRYPDLPTVIVQAAVCRPGWLVEIEGIAAVAHHDSSLPAF